MSIVPTNAADFLKTAGWHDADASPITADWSPRQTSRLRRANGDTAILVHAPTEIPGHALDDFVRLGAVLRDAGLSAPEIYASAPGFLLTEDFGDQPIDLPSVEQVGYETAVDVLAVLRTLDATELTSYQQGYIYKKLPLFSEQSSFMAAWEEAQAALPPCPQVFSHMDYKAGNLHWLGERDGVARIGLLDYQAAQNAPFTYDIVNLLEDARRNLDPALKTDLKKRFYDALPSAWQPMFEDWYVLMAAQFHTRVLGQIRGNARVASDVEPRLKTYLQAEREHPALRPVRSFLDTL